MNLDKITKNLLDKISSLHEIPSTAVSIRQNGKSRLTKSTKNIEIKPKKDFPGIDIFVSGKCKNEACHIPVVVTENGIFDVSYNDFYIQDGAVVTIVAGCGIHTDENSSHEGRHTFHIGKNAQVRYVENHVALGKAKSKDINTGTVINLGENSQFIMETTQIGGVDLAKRKTKAVIKQGAVLNVNEKILTDRFNQAKTDFNVVLEGENSRCNINSRSVAKGESEQEFKSKLVGKTLCFGQVGCDAIVMDNARVKSSPSVDAKSSLATLSHEAVVGKIAVEQITKLMTLGLTKQQAEQTIIEGFLSFN